MEIFEFGLVLLTGGALLCLLADRIGAPYPALLALAGAALAFMPGVPKLRLDPGLALALFVAPALMVAGFHASPRDLRRHWSPIAGLVLAAVATTIALVALVAHAIVPGLHWSAAIALGAIVAPTDASAAIPILRHLSPPHRIMTILEGESLFNDAAALLTYRGALTIVAVGSFHPWLQLPLLFLSAFGGIVAGYLLAKGYLLVAPRIKDMPVSIVMQFVATFLVWILADRLGLSAIITVVVYALTIARVAPLQSEAWLRVQSYAVWDVALLVLNVLAFVLIGMQLRLALPELAGPDGDQWLKAAAAVLVAVLFARAAWVLGYTAFVRWQKVGLRPLRQSDEEHSAWHAGIIISWCGMRGVVTLAAALALPDDFPRRGLLVFVSFAVVLGTLVIQGLTLRPLLSMLTLYDDGLIEREVDLARGEAAREAVSDLRQAPDTPARAALLAEYSREGEVPEDGMAGLQQTAVQAQRRRLAELRQNGDVGEAAFHQVEASIDKLDIGSKDAPA